MTELLEARDLVSGSVSAAPACLQLAPDPASISDLLHDESRMMAAGVASVAEPATLDELRVVLRWHATHGHRVTVSGARTGVVGGAVPDASTHLISLARLRGVVELDSGSTPPTVRALAGTTLRELQAQLAARAPGLALPLDPTEHRRFRGRHGRHQRRRFAGLPLRLHPGLGRRSDRGARVRAHADAAARHQSSRRRCLDPCGRRPAVDDSPAAHPEASHEELHWLRLRTRRGRRGSLHRERGDARHRQ